MNKYHWLAIELKYEGKSYKKISQALKNAIEPESIRNWFNKDGKLYIHYLEYEAEQNKLRKKASESVFEREALNASQVIIQALAKAVKAGDDEKAVEYAEKVLDRAGLVVVRKSEIDTTIKDQEPMSYEEFIAECKRQGIEPTSGLRKRTAEMASN